MHADKDFIFATIYKDASGNVISEDHVRMDIAQWTFVGTGGEQMYAAAPLWKDARLAAAQDPSGPWQDPIDVNGQSSNSFFKSKLQGLPSSVNAQIQVTSQTYTSDSFTDNLQYNGPDPNTAESQNFAALYNGNAYLSTDDTPLTAAQEALIQNNLMLNVAHNDGATTTLTTSADKQQRQVPAQPPIQFTGLTGDVFPTGTTISGSASVAAPNPGKYRVEVSLWLNGQTIAHTPLDGQSNQAFSFTLNSPGLYTVQAYAAPPVAEITSRGQPEGSFTVLVDNTVANSPYKKAAWEALQIGGALGSQPADPVQRNRRITELYANMYNQNKNGGGDHYFKWAGMAAFVSKGVGDAMHSAGVGGALLGIADLAGVQKVPLLGSTKDVRDTISKSYDLLAEGNWDIYMDIYPTFLAYTDRNGRGIKNVQDMLNAGQIGRDLMTAWQTIDAGIRANPVNDTMLWQAVQEMAVYEQRRVLQSRIFDPNRAFWTSFVQNYGSYLTSAVPRSNAFLSVVPVGDIGSADDRIKWFTNDLFPKFQTWVANNPADINVQTLLAGGYN